MSSHPADSSSNGTIPQRCLSSVSTWDSQSEEQTNSYALTSQPSTMRRPSSLQPIDETMNLSSGGMVEYDPADYVTNCIESSGSAPLSLSNPHDSSRLQVQLTQDPQWSPSMDGSISPSTPSSTALMTPITIPDSNMSRQASFNPQFFDENLMLRVHSDSSCVFPPLLSEDGNPISFPFNVTAKNISASVDTSLFPTFTGSSEVFPSPAQFSPSASVLGLSQQQPYLAEDMRRSASASSESNTSNASASSSSTRQSRRDREINAQASRKIAPRVIECNDETKSASSNIHMKRVLSEDGSSKEVAPITKAPYVRPQHPKIMCPYCSARPEGFRGTHELDRHIARAHATIRKGYICVDASAEQKFLANCKHCRNKKVYGAYYNAAAHLRRAHFHPRKRGRKGKNDEKRGGIGGGDDPPMDYLKQHWIKEVDVPGDEKRVKRAASESCFSDNSPIDSSSNTESFEYEPMDTSYPQPTTDMPNMLDFNQGFDTSVFMNSNDNSFDSIPQFTSFNDPNQTTIENFQFDAYVTQ